MNMIEAVKAVFSNYATFSGRARRSEYWWFVLFNIIVSVVLALVMGGNSIVNSLWSLAVLLPSLAAGARRLHDIDRTGWWLLIGFIPVIGLIVLIVFLASKGTPGPNRFGSDPLAA
ncbi:DUF805 domain-containing protein [Tabrizicola sp. TH137]|uniref:DUF805 domain-containing protein n=1 Tax=Tabrizicola sp. TH137 TaxID=2067452 RepID=UPI000C7E4318|nr:DUF805 domain-containing protein [Tabrizicola sp. TH137]PLL11753.1 DUF805 domain-containing protein [Tabrizicola sp. TH137]